MRLKKPIPEPVAHYFREMGQDPQQVLLCTNTDLNFDGAYAEQWVIVTRERVGLFDIQEGRARELRGFDVADIKSAWTDGRVGSGFLQIHMNDDTDEELARFSYESARKFGRIAHKIKQLADKGDFVITPEDEVVDSRCPKCGNIKSRHMVVCPKCLSRSAALVRIIKMMFRYWPMAVGAVLIMLVSVVMSLLAPQISQPFFDDILSRDPNKTTPWFQSLIGWLGIDAADLIAGLVVIVVLRIGLNSLGSLMQGTSSRLAAVLGTRVTFDLRQTVHSKLQELSVRFHDERSPGTLMNRCVNDVAGFRDFIWQMTNGILRSLLMLAGAIMFMIAVSPKLALITLIPAPIVFGLTVWFVKHMVPKHRRKADRGDRLVSVVLASLRGVRVVKNFAQEPRETERFTRYNQRDRDAALDVNASQAVFGPTSNWIFGLGIVVLTWVGGKAVLNGELTIGMLVKFIGYMNLCYNQLGVLHGLNNWITHLTVVSYRVFEVLDSESEVPERKDATDVDMTGEIKVEDLTFGYDENRPVLKDINLTIAPGEMVGLVGHSGSGKTTLVNLIGRFYDPQEGSIKIDGVDIRDIRKSSLRHQIGVVLQDPQLFQGTIAENIAYGRKGATPEVIMNAAVAANCHGFITRLADGYDTLLSERGHGLSGGEKQRVAIARALLFDPKILILDEATSNVDTVTEVQIQRALEVLTKGRTTIAIAHRLSTLRNADRIIVFEEGEIREVGTHEELMAKKGVYHHMVEIQTKLSRDRDTVDKLNEVAEVNEMLDKADKQPAPPKDRPPEPTEDVATAAKAKDDKQSKDGPKDEAAKKAVKQRGAA
jgi:ATP-binding cassette, subfamily B, bacterial